MNPIFSTPRLALLGAAVCATSACSIMPAGGPSTHAVNKLADVGSTSINGDIKIIPVTDAVARRVIASERNTHFADTMGDGIPVGSMIGRGDVLDIAVWEAPPAALFGSGGGDPRIVSSGATARGTTLPEQMVDSDGRVTIPFIGYVQAAGRTPQQVAQTIRQRLIGMAHDPQVVVRTVRSATTNVTVVGDVANSARVPLTARGERLLDVLATVGGVKQPINKMTVQITRGERIASMPLEGVIKDPRQNIRLQPDDVVTALYQPYSFTALGAAGRNEELPFEGTGITLSQALGRIAGLQDNRANTRGVFIFRLENTEAVDPTMRVNARLTPDGKLPVIYQIDVKDPGIFFVAQAFPIKDKDVLYVSNAPLVDIQKFVNVIYSAILPVATAITVAP
ncbi:polysaccharide biosynthesis/export family protein [Sphingobium sp. EM0848]|uniref:polysaccharide biosynthesis/export family protein n=1 Tax=Sphingobium sp. EM0848 TaxID=2743473 RepID=UPI00159C3877|nr:polysaccharide biosynthesis/export family protein [Sphingobium sp. EM0848]